MFWYAGSVLACLLGMASKEVMIFAPLMVLLYDRTFCAGSFREAWRRRYALYLCLAGTWLLLGWLVLSMSPLGTSKGPGTQEFTSWSYLLTQPGVIVHYLRLSVWPWPLCLDYDWPAARSVADVLWPAIVVVGLLAATVWALVKRPAWGFLGAWFFGILALTSSVVALGQAAFEHRMYLSLAAVVTGIVVGGWVAGQWFVRRGIIPLLASQLLGGALALVAGAALGILTFQRNVDYQSELSIWEDTVAKAPGNAGAHNSLGLVLVGRGQLDEAIAHYRKALEIKPDDVGAHNNLGLVLADRGQLDEAIAHYRKVLDIEPDSAQAHSNLGLALAEQGRLDEAIVHLRKTTELSPRFAESHFNLANALAKLGQFDEMAAEYHKAMEINPEFADAYNNLGIALGRYGWFDEAMAHFQRGLELKPDYTDARNNLSFTRSLREELLKVLAGRRESLRSHPDDIVLLNETAWVLATNPNASIRNGAEAVELAQRAVQLSDGREPAVLGTLAAAYAEAGRFSEAVQAARTALQLAAEQNKQPLAESIKAKIALYEAQTPYHEMLSSPTPHTDHP